MKGQHPAAEVGEAQRPDSHLQQQQQQGTAADGAAWQSPEVVGLALLHPDLSGKAAPKYARVLAHSRLGRHKLRQLLRTDLVFEVSYGGPALVTPMSHLDSPAD